MKIINYFNNELHGDNFILTPLQYTCSDEELNYWLGVIKSSYGQYGKVTYSHVPNPISPAELQRNLNARVLKSSAELQIILHKQKKFNADLLLQLAKLGGE